MARALVPLALLSCLVALPDARADTMRCGTQLVASGDSMYIVRSRCGEPDEQQHRSVVRTTQRWVSRPCSTPDSKVAQCGQSTQESVEVAIDEWLYDFGPLAFVQRLVFEQGRLVAVVSSERGRKQRGAALKADAPAAGSATRADGLSPSAKPARPWWAR